MKKLVTLFSACLLSAGPLFAQWNSDPTQPVTVFSNGQKPYAVQAENGNIFVSSNTTQEGTWSFVLNLQLLDKNGNVLWGENGVNVCDYPTKSYISNYKRFAVASDGSAVLTFVDSRDNPDAPSIENEKMYAYKVDQDGNHMWGEEGLALPMDPGCSGYNSGVYAFGDYIYVTYISDYTYLIKLNLDGTQAWESPITEGAAITNIIPCNDGTDDLLIVRWGITVQRIKAETGETVWETSVSTVPYDSYIPLQSVSDGKGGVVLAWVRFMGPTSHMVCVQHVSADGELMMGLNELDVYAEEVGDHTSFTLAVNPTDEKILVVWLMDYGNQYLMGNVFDYYGTRLWGDHGLALQEKSNPAGYSYTASSALAMEDGSWFIVWEDTEAWATTQIYAARLDENGESIWNKNVGPLGDVSDMSVIYDDTQAYIFWNSTDENYNSYVVGQNITFDGESGQAGVEGIADNGESGIIYFAPTNELRLAGSLQGATITLYNLQGAAVAEFSDCGSSITLPDLEKGLYIVHAQGQNDNASKKILIQ